LLTADREFSEMENIYLAQMPKFSFSAILDSSKNGFAQKYEKYTNEQFLMRDSWINIKSLCETILLKKENNGIIYGGDGYMFDKFTSYDIKRKEKNMEALMEFGEKHTNTKKTLLIAPSASAVLKDEMPMGFAGVDQWAELEELKSVLTPRGFQYIDVGNALADAAKNGDQVYYKTDHHWTTKGAYSAYIAFCNARGLNPAEYDEILASNDFLGTHYSKCKKLGAEKDSIYYYAAPVTEILVAGKAKNGLYDFEQLDKRDKYAFFLWGNNGVTEILNENAERSETIMVIKDSYANCFVPFLTQNYKAVVVVDLRSLPENLSEVIAKYSPTEILLNYNIKNILTDTDLPALKY
ncbi:MAG: DHHW family protein, partial [Oscillospiraceae bacterium]